MKDSISFRLSRERNALALRLLSKSFIMNNEPNISEKYLLHCFCKSIMFCIPKKDQERFVSIKNRKWFTVMDFPYIQI
jgi:hypothetical protein